VSELSSLFRLVRERKPRIVVEIGTAHGGTFWAWCKLATDDGLLVSIDFPGGDATSIVDGKDLYGKRNLDRLHSYGRADQELHLWLADSHAAGTISKLEGLLEGRKIDFLFIDGDHSYEGVKKDYELYLSFVDGVIAFHDIIHHTKIPDAQVHRLWKEIRGKHKTQEFTDHTQQSGRGPWGGIGVIHTEKAKVLA
jgi:predicted O-methyltransferase YrrM